MLLITGSTGNSGSYLMQELEAAGYVGPIRCIVREGTSTEVLENMPLEIEVLRGDLSDEDFLHEACAGVTTIMHIASIKFSLQVVRAALANDVNRVILVHTTGIYSKYKAAASDYQAIEASLKDLVEEQGNALNVVILRPTMIFGQPFDRNVSVFIRLVDRTRLLPLIQGGGSLIQPVHASDLGRAYMQVLQTETLPENDYILSGQRPIALREMLSTIGVLLGKRVHYLSVPFMVAEFGAVAARSVTRGRVDVVEKVQRLVEDRSFSHHAATRDFSYNPADFLQNLEREVMTYMRNKGVDK